MSFFTCPGEWTIWREVCYDLKPYNFEIHLKHPGGQPILCEAAFNVNLLCGQNTGARLWRHQEMKHWKTSGPGLKHYFITCKMAEAGGSLQENHVDAILQVKLAGWWEFFSPSGPHLMVSQDDGGNGEGKGEERELTCLDSLGGPNSSSILTLSW